MKKQLKKARMNISHFCFILFNLKIFGEIVTTLKLNSRTHELNFPSDVAEVKVGKLKPPLTPVCITGHFTFSL